MSISEVSVRWTGHLFAISSNLDARCNRELDGPENRNSDAGEMMEPGAEADFRPPYERFAAKGRDRRALKFGFLIRRLSLRLTTTTQPFTS
jgi:hypothetical protein